MSTNPQGPLLDVQLGQILRTVMAGLRRQWIIIATTIAVLVALATAFVLLATPKFTATAILMVDPRVSNGPISTSAPTMLLPDPLIVDSEIQVILSSELARRVIDKLHLTNDPHVNLDMGTISQASYSVRKFLDAYINFEDPPPVLPNGQPDPVAIAARKTEEAGRWFAKQLDVERSGDTYVVTVSFTSGDAAFAAKVTNAIVEQYFTMQAEAVYDNTRRIGQWLSERVQLLGDSVVSADHAIEAFKKDNQLYNVHGEQLPNNAEFSSANDQLITLRNEALNLTAAAGQLKDIIKNGSMNAALDPAIRTQSLVTLQAKYSDLIGRARDLSARYGATHALAVRANQDAEATKALILDEYRKILEAMENRLAIVNQQVADTESRIGGLRDVSASDAQKLVRLHELEREAASKRALYEAMLKKMDETDQQESYRSAPARIVATATPPDKKSSPQSKLILALSVIAGFAIGSGIGFLREQMDNVFRRSNTITDLLGVPLLGLIPLFSDDRKMSVSNSGHTTIAQRARHAAGLFSAKHYLLGKSRYFRFCVDNPASMFSETLRSVLFAVSPDPVSAGAPGRQGRVVGITSTLKGEGKTTISANLASFNSAQGKRTVIIDFDVRNPTLTRLLHDRPHQQSLNEVLRSPEILANLETSQTLAGAAVVSNDGDRSAIMASDPAFLRRFAAMIEVLKQNYDLIIIDFPPITNLVDVRAVATVVEQVVLVVEWGKTRRDIASRAVLTNRGLKSKLIGAVYSKVPLEKYLLHNEIDQGKYYFY